MPCLRKNVNAADRWNCSIIDLRSREGQNETRLKRLKAPTNKFAPLVAIAQVLDDFQLRFHVVPTLPF
jgi:hypothetical protein